jgi:hypothetical protein
MRAWLIVIACALPLWLGCGPKSQRAGHKVTGKVTLNGQPVADAKVVFTDGKDAGATANGPTALTDEGGEYTLVGVPPGTYKVVVYKFKPRPGAKLPPEGEGLDMEQLEASGMGAHALPQKYSRPATTNLTATVESGENVVDLKLTGQ